MYKTIILNYNNLSKLAFALESLKKNSFYKPSITVIDNNSTDGSVDYLKLKKIDYVKNDENKLFTRAYVDYFREHPIKEKYFVIANNDLLFEKDWDKSLIDFMEKNEKCGIVAPMLIDILGQQVQNMGGLPDFCGHKGGVPEQWKHPEENWWTTFACVLIRTEAYQKVGGFDEQFLFYCSDSSLCIEMKLNGYSIYNIPQSKVRHYHSSSTQEEVKKGSPIMQVGQQDQIKFCRKYEMHGIRIGNNKYPITEAVLNGI